MLLLLLLFVLSLSLHGFVYPEPFEKLAQTFNTVYNYNPDYSLEWLMLKLQYFGHLTQTANLLEKTVMLGKFEGKRRRWQQRIRWLDGITNAMDMNLGKPGDEKDAWCARVHGVANSRAELGNWTTWLKVVQTPTHWNIPWDLFWKEVCIDQQKAVETETIICAPSSVQHLIKQRCYQAVWGSPTPEYWNLSPMVVLMLMNTVVHLKMLNHHLP